MMKIIGGLLLVVVAVSLAMAAASAADSATPITGGCPREGIHCLDIYQPVICSNGVIYPNACAAYVDCATDCVDYGDDTQ